MKNKYLLILVPFLLMFTACKKTETKTETVVQPYTPPAATLYGIWLLNNTSVTDSSDDYLIFVNDGSNFFYSFTQDKYGFRTLNSSGVYSATDKQVILSSSGIFNYRTSHDSLFLKPSASIELVAVKVSNPTFNEKTFLTMLNIEKTGKPLKGMAAFNYGFGFNKDTMFFLSNHTGTIYGYKYNLNNRNVLDSWSIGVIGSLHYNSGSIFHGYSTNFRLAKREDKKMGAIVFASANKLTDVKNLSINTSTNFIYAYQSNHQIYTGIDAGTLTQFYDFTLYNSESVVYHNSDIFLMLRGNNLYKVKIAPTFQVLASYQFPVNYDITTISSNGTDVWVYAYDNSTAQYQFMKVMVP